MNTPKRAAARCPLAGACARARAARSRPLVIGLSAIFVAEPRTARRDTRCRLERPNEPLCLAAAAAAVDRPIRFALQSALRVHFGAVAAAAPAPPGAGVDSRPPRSVATTEARRPAQDQFRCLTGQLFNWFYSNPHAKRPQNQDSDVADECETRARVLERVGASNEQAGATWRLGDLTRALKKRCRESSLRRRNGSLWTSFDLIWARAGRDQQARGARAASASGARTFAGLARQAKPIEASRRQVARP